MDSLQRKINKEQEVKGAEGKKLGLCLQGTQMETCLPAQAVKVHK